jgi:ATP-dependent exoDNAse (exonuclease V) alpha subunit
MAADALAGYQADTAAGKDAILVCETTEMADALNQRIHQDTISADAPRVIAARGHRIAVGDLILTRYNDASIPLRNTDDLVAVNAPVRNGQRWRVTRINPDNNRLIARRLDDHTLGAFVNDYVREHITHGYAVTVHSAQGVTADTTHAGLSETATRALPTSR